MVSEVQIVSRRAHPSELRQPEPYRLRFPTHWRAQPVANPAAAAMEHGTLEWLAGYGMGTNPADLEKLRQFECGKYGGYSLPRAQLAEGLLITQFISLWLFWDDVEVEETTQFGINDVVSAFLTGKSQSKNRYVLAWTDLARRLRERASLRWSMRTAQTMREWLENAQRETQLGRELRRAGTWPALETLFECRTISIGMYPTFYLIEIAENIELPDEFHDHSLVKSLKRTASRLVGMGNDLSGFAKDVQNRWLNLVIAQARPGNMRIEDAYRRLVELHNREVLEFDRNAALLPSFGAKLDPMIQTRLEAVRYSVYGFALWETTAERYQEYMALTQGGPLLATVEHIDAVSSLADTAGSALE